MRPPHRLTILLLIACGLLAGIAVFRRWYSSPATQQARAKAQAESARVQAEAQRIYQGMSRAGVPDPYGHVWAWEPRERERFAFAEVLDAYTRTEAPSGQRGPAFMGMAMCLGRCAKKGERFTLREVVACVGNPDYSRTCVDGGQLLAYGGLVEKRKFTVSLTISPSGLLASAGFNFDEWPPGMAAPATQAAGL